MRRVTTSLPLFDFYISGNNPKLLIHSGTHGDEAEVTEFVIKALQKYEQVLPSFIFVPEVSPSAVALKTRNNARGVDMNRKFFSDSTDPEVQVNIQLIKEQKFDIFVSFHEDSELNEYYCYDVSWKKGVNKFILAHNRLLKEKGVNLLNGIDDEKDEDLGFEFREGYNKLEFLESMKDDGTISAWVLKRHIAEDYLLPEIPGKADRKMKQFIVESFFEEVIMKCGSTTKPSDTL